MLVITVETRVRARDFKLSWSKAEYMQCNFSTNEITRGTIKLQEKEIASSIYFKYIGSIFKSSENTEQDVTHRIQCGW